jgi:hypothetical protein
MTLVPAQITRHHSQVRGSGEPTQALHPTLEDLHKQPVMTMFGHALEAYVTAHCRYTTTPTM